MKKTILISILIIIAVIACTPSTTISKTPPPPPEATMTAQQWADRVSVTTNDTTSVKFFGGWLTDQQVQHLFDSVRIDSLTEAINIKNGDINVLEGQVYFQNLVIDSLTAKAETLDSTIRQMPKY